MDRICESSSDTLSRLDGKANLELLNSCAEGAWRGVLSLPEQIQVYGALAENLGSAIHQGMVEHREWMESCDHDPACRLDLARQIAANRVRNPDGEFTLSDAQLLEQIKGEDFNQLAMAAQESRASFQRACDGHLRHITEDMQSAINTTDSGWTPTLLNERYLRLRNWDPLCPIQLKLRSPDHLNSKTTWLQTLGIQYDCQDLKQFEKSVCLEIAKQVLDPMIVWGGAKLGWGALKTAGMRLATRQSARLVSEALTDTTLKAAQGAEAETILGRPLTLKQIEAVDQAHRVGLGEKGADGSEAGVFNYTAGQLKRKAQILNDAGFSEQERRQLIEGEIVGAKTTTSKDINATLAKAKELKATDAEVEILRDLVRKKQLSSLQLKELIERQNTELLEDLLDSGKITNQTFNQLHDAFTDIPLLKPASGLRPTEVPVKAPDGSLQVQKYMTYKAEGNDESVETIVMLNPKNFKPSSYFEYRIDPDAAHTLEVTSAFTIRTERQKGLSEVLYQMVLREHPEIKAIKSDLLDVNQKVLENGIDRGLSPTEAAKETPAYKARAKLGFTDFKIQKHRTDYGNEFWELISTRPEP